jgi:ketosteroid isomerase-like protein
MTKKLSLFAALLVLAPLAARAQEDVSALLQRQTQEMVDAIASGGSQVWERYLDDKVVYTAEDGTVSTKAELVEGIKPLPPGVSGTIKVIDFKVAQHGDVAVASYLNDEHETYHGHELHCQYRTTDTWRKTPAGWRLIAGQVLAVRTDPPAVPLTQAQMEEYVGTYQLSPDVAYEIRRSADGLEGQQTGRKWEPMKAEAPDVLFIPGKPRYRWIFRRGAGGRITGLIERREAWDLDWTRK